MTKLKVPETFKPVKDLEEKIDKLTNKIEELKKDCIISTTCSKFDNIHVTVKFENDIPTGIICKLYSLDSQYSCGSNTNHQCIYKSGFKPLKTDKEEYQK